MKLLGQVPIRMGQINPYGYSWNFAPATGYAPVIPNTYGGAPAYVAPPAPAAVEVGSGCFTCVNPSSGDTQYGVPAAMATTLKGQGYRCRADDCANRSASQSSDRSMFQAVGLPSAPTIVSNGNFGNFGGGEEGGMMLQGSRIPLAGGLGRRALTGMPF